MENRNLSEKEKRWLSFDLLRIVAAVMVVLLHVAASLWSTVPPDSTEWKAMNFYNSLTRSAVPLFFMLSGAFILNKDISIKLLYFKKVVSLCMIYVTWSFLYAVDSIGLVNISSYGIKNLIDVIGESYFHLWFIPVLIGIYMLQPVLRAIVDYKDGKYIRYYLVLFFVFSIMRNTILLFLSESISKSVVNRIPVELMSYCGYTILGYFLEHKVQTKMKIKYCLLSFAFAVICTITISTVESIKQGVPISKWYDNFCIITFIEAISLFLVFKKISLKCSCITQGIIRENYRLSVKRKIDIKAALARQNLVFRWLVYYGMILTVLIFGIYGPEYDATAFIYFQF